jgi:hypothetical protein
MRRSCINPRIFCETTVAYSNEQVGKGGLPPLASPSFDVGANWVGQRGQATLPYLFVSSSISVMIVGLMSFLFAEGLQTRKGRSRPNRRPVITSFSSSPKTVVRCKLSMPIRLH